MTRADTGNYLFILFGLTDAEASPGLCEKWTRATGLWAVPVKEASSSESGNVECGFNGWKRKGVGGSDGEKVGVLCVQETRCKGNKAR